MIAAVILAAGAARRFGKQKLLESLQGKPLVRWTVERVLASGVGGVRVVVGREAASVRDALAGLPVGFVPNPRFGEGLSTSLRAGVEALEPEVEAALVVLGDQPGVAPAVMRRCIDAFRRAGSPIVAASYRGQRGHPVLFARSVFPELLAVEGDQGARSLIARDPARVEWVEIETPPPPDVDTPRDLARLRADADTGAPAREAPGGESRGPAGTRGAGLRDS